MKTTLYILGTPIGNLKDISQRALETLKEVNFIICEDTRHTLKLLNYYNIKKSLVSYHQHSKIKKVDSIIKRLISGESAALVSDAGTPGIADPGGRLVDEISAELAHQVEIRVIPGVSAVAAAASVSGLPCDKFLFLGFLPHKKGRETLFKRIAESKETVIFYESPHRILKTLESLEKVLGEKRRVVICRELTKIHEEVIGGNINEINSFFKKTPEKVRGEFVVLVGSKPSFTKDSEGK